jgi:DNA-binding HxlR family transcriptional regulator
MQPEDSSTNARTGGPDAATLDALDDTIHQKARLAIMSTLLALGESDFKLLKESLALSDGNLSTHLTILEERGFIAAHKEFVRRKPHTTYVPTDAGRDAFQRYLQTLERIIRAAQPVEEPARAAGMPATHAGAATPLA